MASFVFTNAKRGIMAGEIDLNADDIRVALLMTNTTVTSNEDVTTISGITTLDEMDGSGYARQALANEAVTADNANDRGEFDADDVVFATLGNGTRQIAGVLIYKHVDGTNANDIPIAWNDSGGFPLNPNGANFTIQWNAEGIIQGT